MQLEGLSTGNPFRADGVDSLFGESVPFRVIDVGLKAYLRRTASSHYIRCDRYNRLPQSLQG